jgi:hypothetical protein
MQTLPEPTIALFAFLATTITTQFHPHCMHGTLIQSSVMDTGYWLYYEYIAVTYISWNCTILNAVQCQTPYLASRSPEGPKICILFHMIIYGGIFLRLSCLKLVHHAIESENSNPHCSTSLGNTHAPQSSSKMKSPTSRRGTLGV